MAKISKNNVGHRCANFLENPAHQGTHHNSQVKATIIYIICDITTDTIKNVIVLHTYRTKNIELFESVRSINRQHDYSYIFDPTLLYITLKWNIVTVNLSEFMKPGKVMVRIYMISY